MSDNILDVAHVNKTYNGVRALIDFDFAVRRGEVHCLVGENGCGKSTFMKIVAGVIKPDRSSATRLEINGKSYHRISPADSVHEGIQVIYQDLSLFPNLSVAENIAMNQRIEERKKGISWKAMADIARKAMESISVDLDPEELIENYPIAKQQMVAICRAITSGVKLIIMDEPTASLGKTDVDHLFHVIQLLKERGISVLFVGHKLHEVFAIADRITVMRDGHRIRTVESVSDTSEQEIIELMTGRTFSPTQYLKRSSAVPLLEVRGLTKAGQYADVSFTLNKGDVLGIIGLVGAGRTELATTVFGLNPADGGTIMVDGKGVRIRNARDAIRLGIGFVPENRLAQGLFTEKTIRDNIVVTVIQQLRGHGPLLNTGRIEQTARDWIKELNVKTNSSELAVKQLSGGNQQRIVLSKWLATNPRILILDEPTVGIDVGAKSEIHEYMRSLAEKGMGIIMITDETQEVLENANRIIVMKDGRIIREIDAADATESMLKDMLR